MFGSEKRAEQRRKRQEQQAYETGRYGTPQDYAAARDEIGPYEREFLYKGAIDAYVEDGHPRNVQLILTDPERYAPSHGVNENTCAELLATLINKMGDENAQEIVQTALLEARTSNAPDFLNNILWWAVRHQETPDSLLITLMDEGAVPTTRMRACEGTAFTQTLRNGRPDAVLTRMVEAGADPAKTLAYMLDHPDSYKQEHLTRLKDFNAASGGEPLTADERAAKRIAELEATVAELTTRLERLESAVPPPAAPEPAAPQPPRPDFKKVMGGP